MRLENECILPEQMTGRRSPDTPMRTLMFAVLMRALEDVRFVEPIRREWHVRCQKHPIDVAENARAWFESPEASWPFSFIRICDGLALDPDYWRAKARTIFRAGALRRTYSHAVTSHVMAIGEGTRAQWYERRGA